MNHLRVGLFSMMFVAVAHGAGQLNQASEEAKIKLNRWIADHASVEFLKVSTRFIGSPRTISLKMPSQERVDQEFLFRWPDAMLLQEEYYFRGKNQDQWSGDWQQSGSFVRVFCPDATVRASVAPGEAVVADVPMLFAEGAWRYSQVSPWLVAKLLGAEPDESVAVTKAGSEVHVLIAREHQRFVFSNDAALGLRLESIAKLSTSGVPAAMFVFSDYHKLANLPFSVPERRTDWWGPKVFNSDTGKTEATTELSPQGVTLLAHVPLTDRPRDEVFILSPARTSGGGTLNGHVAEIDRGEPATEGGISSPRDPLVFPEPAPVSFKGGNRNWIWMLFGVGALFLGAAIALRRRK